MEAAARNVKELSMRQDNSRQEESSKDMHKLVANGGRQSEVRKEEKEEGSRRPCYRCGKQGHLSASCRYRNAKCHNCGKTGHLRVVCRSKPQNPHSDNGKQNKVSHLGGDTEEYSLFQLEGKKSPKPMEVTLTVDGREMTMEVDTGAAWSLVSKSMYQKIWHTRPLKPSLVNLRTYTGEAVTVLGTAEVEVVYKDQVNKLPLLVVDGNGPTLLGRDWLACIKLDWSAINHVQSSLIDSVLARHKKVFEEGLGTMQGFEAKLHVDPHAQPRFCKARSIPYALKGKVEDELQRLVSEGILKPVQYAEWAAPIVPVLKKDGDSVRICGDFKQTINKVSNLDKYPIPRIEDLMTKLTGGKKFTVLDLSQAYQQVCLEETSQKYVVINTHKGLFGYTRLPYGVASAQESFNELWKTC